MIDFPLYRITDEHNNDILTEDPEMMREYITMLLEKTDEVTIKRLR